MKTTSIRVVLFVCLISGAISVSSQSSSQLVIQDVQPYVIPADGKFHKLDLKGEGFTRDMWLFLDGESYPFDFSNDKKVSVKVKFNTSHVHYLDIVSYDSTLFSAWEKNIVAIKSGDGTLSKTKSTGASGDFLNVFSLNPGFDQSVTVYFRDAAGGSQQATNVVYLDKNEIEVEAPALSPGTFSIVIDNHSTPDLILNDRFTVVGQQQGVSGVAEQNLAVAASDNTHFPSIQPILSEQD